MVKTVRRDLLSACALFGLLAACVDDNPVGRGECRALVSGRCWRNLGPAGEWTTAIALTPLGVFAGTKSNGVLKYDSSRSRWVTLGLAGRTITSITALPPTNRLLVTVTPNVPDTVSALLYASDDGGRTWYERDGGLSAARAYYGYAFSLAFDAGDTKRLYVGLPASVVRSEDAGVTWRAVSGSPQSPGLGVNALTVSQRSSGRVWAAGQNARELPFVLRSDDRGDTWQEFTPTPTFGVGVFAMAADPSSDDRLFLGMWRRVQVTEDAGATWRALLSTELPGSVTGVWLDDSRLVAVSDEYVSDASPPATVLRVYASSDRGSTWEALAVPAAASGALALAVGPGRVAFIATRSGIWSVPLP